MKRDVHQSDQASLSSVLEKGFRFRWLAMTRDLVLKKARHVLARLAKARVDGEVSVQGQKRIEIDQEVNGARRSDLRMAPEDHAEQVPSTPLRSQ